jgi:UDP-N-acetylmuramoyl-tripeptide--D-alanyl-D-alanine ligase
MLAAVEGTESGSRFKRRIVVAGEMLELGETGAELHRKSGENVARNRIDLLVGVRGLGRELIEGARAAGMAAESTLFCESSEEAAKWLIDRVQEGDLLLVKGSRGVKTDLIVDALKQRYELEGS